MNDLQQEGGAIAPLTEDAQLSAFVMLDERVRTTLSAVGNAYSRIGAALHQIETQSLWQAGGYESYSAYLKALGLNPEVASYLGWQAMLDSNGYSEPAVKDARALRKLANEHGLTDADVAQVIALALATHERASERNRLLYLEAAAALIVDISSGEPAYIAEDADLSDLNTLTDATLAIAAELEREKTGQVTKRQRVRHFEVHKPDATGCIVLDMRDYRSGGDDEFVVTVWKVQK